MMCSPRFWDALRAFDGACKQRMSSRVWLFRSGVKRFVRNYALNHRRIVIEIGSTYSFPITSRAANILLKKLRVLFGPETHFRLNIFVDKSVGCGILVFLGEDRVVLDFSLDASFGSSSASGIELRLVERFEELGITYFFVSFFLHLPMSHCPTILVSASLSFSFSLSSFPL